MTDDVSPSAEPALSAALDALCTPYARSDAPGVALGVRWQGRMIYRRGHGLACVAQGGVLRPTTPLRVGSVSKQFCCWALLKLADAGLLALDADVRAVLPELDAALGPITPRQMMQHTSGLRCHLDLWTLCSAMRAPLREAEVRALLLGMRGGNFTPGTRLIYSNGAYWLLSEVVRRLSGQTLGDFLQDRLLGPLGMHDTCLVPLDGKLGPGWASQHVRQADGGWRRGHMPLPFAGDGGLVSTLDDLLRWLAYLDQPEAAQTYAQMQQRVRFSALAGSEERVGDYGLGLCLRPYRGRMLVGHAGAVLGGQAEILKVRDEALDVVVLSNRNDLSAIELARRVIDTVLGERLGPARVRADAAALGDWAGLYRAGDGQLIRLGLDDGQAQIDLGGAKAALWQREGAPGWWCAGSLGDLMLWPHPGRRDGLCLREDGREDWLQRLPADAGGTDACATQAARLPGRYRHADLSAELQLHLDETGQPLLDLQWAWGRARYRLHALAPGLWQAHDATGEMAYAFAVEAVPSGLRLSSIRTRQLDFIRVAGSDPLCFPP